MCNFRFDSMWNNGLNIKKNLFKKSDQIIHPSLLQSGRKTENCSETKSRGREIYLEINLFRFNHVSNVRGRRLI